MNASKTRHLDTAIEIFSGGKAKRAPRKAQVEITVMAASNGYVIQANNKIVETGAGDAEYAKARAEARADSIRKLGKTVIVTIYGEGAMSTSRELIEQAQRDVKPRDVLCPGVFPEARSLLPLDCGSLKRLVDLSAERRLNWEEWLDVREAWCRCFHVQYVACTRSDRAAIQNAAFQGERTGQHYILIDFV